MNNITQATFKHKVHAEFFPTETLLGFKTINTEILCDDGKYRPLYGFEIGIIFFKIGYGNMPWKPAE